MSSAVTIIIALVVVIGLPLLFVIVKYNGLVVARNLYRNSFAQIDVQLKRRYDLIPNLVETAKGYMSHERDTLEAVITARNQPLFPPPPVRSPALSGASRRKQSPSSPPPPVRSPALSGASRRKQSPSSNIRNFPRSSSPNTNRRSTTREVRWYTDGLSSYSAHGVSQRFVPFLPNMPPSHPTNPRSAPMTKGRAFYQNSA
jgi:hypothetical protein